MTLQTLLLDLFVLAVFGGAIYSFLILPRQREFKKRQQFVAALQVGATVITYGGLIGVVKAIDTERGLVAVEIAEGVTARFLAAAIMGEYDAGAIADSTRRALG